jgi:hypothetical protein
MCDSGVSSGQAREMNEPEDRPTTSSAPGPQGDPPDTAPAPLPAAGGPPAESATGGPPPEPLVPSGEPASPATEPEATWEDVVDPEPAAATPAPARAEVAGDEWPAPNRVRTARPVPVPEDDEEDFEEYLDAPASRWVSLMATIGTALIGIVTVQVLTSLVEGLTLENGQRVQVPDDLFHRLGYPFGGLGATALVFLVLGVVLVSMPSVLDELLSEAQDRVVGVALIVAVVMGVLIAIGSLLAVRANLHEYAAKNVPVPTYVRVQFTNFLLGSLGAAALALFAAIAAMNERSRENII